MDPGHSSLNVNSRPTPRQNLLHCDVVESNVEKENNSNASDEFILSGYYYAIVLDSSSPHSVWFIKIINRLESNVEIIDAYENKIAPGQSWKVEVSAKGFLFKLSKKKTYFLKESGV